jgi:asparagine synthetase B (glutamine-hydrolysing)
LKTFSVGFAQKEFDESTLASLVSRYCNTEHRTYFIGAEDARAAIDPILSHVGEPYAFPSAIASYYMFKLASHEVTVTLTGDGSDEAFGGYRRYRKVIEQLSLANRAAGSLTDTDGKMAKKPCFKDAYHSILASGLSDGLKAQLYSESLHKLVPASFPSNYIEECERHVGHHSSLLDRMMLVDFRFWLPDAQLVKIDRMAMAHSVEPRSPMLDNQLLEFVGGISADLKIVGQSEKDILKLAARDYLPESIVFREKQELAVPLEEWLSASLAELVRKTLLSEASLDRGYFQPDALRNFVNANRREHSYALWTLFMLERWHQLTESDGDLRTMRAEELSQVSPSYRQEVRI